MGAAAGWVGALLGFSKSRRTLRSAVTRTPDARWTLVPVNTGAHLSS